MADKDLAEKYLESFSDVLLTYIMYYFSKGDSFGRRIGRGTNGKHL